MPEVACSGPAPPTTPGRDTCGLFNVAAWIPWRLDAAASMKVLMVSNSDWGMYKSNLHLAAELLAQGIEVVLLCPEGPYSARMREAGHRVLDWHLRRRSLAPITEARALLHLIRHYRKERPDAVHHFTIKPNLYGTIAAHVARVPHVLNTWTGLGYVFSDALQAKVLRLFLLPLMRLLRRSARVWTIFEIEHDRQALLHLGVVEHERTTVIGSSVDSSRFAPHKGRADGPPVVLMAARLLHTKGVVELVAAAELLRESGIRVRTVIAGVPDPGNPGSFTDREIAHMRRGGCAEFLGHVEDMPGLLRRANLAVLPTYYNEGVPLFLLEAAASGLPLIGTDIGGCQVIVRPGVNGLIVPARDPKALAEAIATLVSNPALRAQMGAASREIAIREFDQSQVIEQYWDVYRAVGVLT